MSQNDRSSSRTSWLFRNVHVSNGNVCFLFFVDYFVPQSSTRLSPDLIMSNTASDIRIGNCLPFASAWAHPAFFGGVRVFHLPIFSFWYRFFFVCLLYLVSIVFYVSELFIHDCPFRFIYCLFISLANRCSPLCYIQTVIYRYITSKSLCSSILHPNRCIPSYLIQIIVCF